MQYIYNCHTCKKSWQSVDITHYSGQPALRRRTHSCLNSSSGTDSRTATMEGAIAELVVHKVVAASTQVQN